MARMAAKEKMGFYPTPNFTLYCIASLLKRPEGEPVHILDPCCGAGEALKQVALSVYSYIPGNYAYGIELDIERAEEADEALDFVVQGSIFNAIVDPEGSMGLLYLNPPYDTSEREREEMRFLKHSVKWLCSEGILVFIVPEHIFTKEKHRRWISSWFKECSIYRIAEEEYPRFKQVVLFGRKRSSRVDAPDLPQPPYPYIDAAADKATYIIRSTAGPAHFKAKDAVSDEEIADASIETEALIRRHLLKDRLQGALSPLFPLRKGHLVALITAGFLNGKVSSGPGEDDFILIKGYSERVQNTSTDEETNKEITTDTYRVGMRVIDPQAKVWFDIV